MSEPKLLCEFALAARWRDLDAFGHANNSTFLTYVEEARLHWFGMIAGPWLTENSAPVVAAVTANYRKQLNWPAQLVVQLYCERLGNSSLTIAFRIEDAAKRDVVYSDGQTVLVWIDTASGKPIALPEAIRNACKK